MALVAFLLGTSAKRKHDASIRVEVTDDAGNPLAGYRHDHALATGRAWT